MQGNLQWRLCQGGMEQEKAKLKMQVASNTNFFLGIGNYFPFQDHRCQTWQYVGLAFRRNELGAVREKWLQSLA